MKFTIIMSVILMSACSAFADGGEYQLYLCDDNASASIKCEACKKSDSVTVTFKVQPLNNNVLQTIYADNEVVNDSFLNNCRVVDSKNWQCEDFIKTSIVMSNGKYRTLFVGANGKVRATCGKKKSFFN
jgi:hypothetical protein